MNTIKVLDHGFVTLRNLAGPTRRVFNGAVDHLRVDDAAVTQVLTEDLRAFDADDTDVANAARLSFEQQDGNRTYEAEMKLTRYLLTNQHMTPFESIEVWLEMKLPIFVARQFVRQRTQSINEASARYITLPAEWYIPEVVGGKAANKKQGQEDNLDRETQERFKQNLQALCESSYHRYSNSSARVLHLSMHVCSSTSTTTHTG